MDIFGSWIEGSGDLDKELSGKLATSWLSALPFALAASNRGDEPNENFVGSRV